MRTIAAMTTLALCARLYAALAVSPAGQGQYDLCLSEASDSLSNDMCIEVLDFYSEIAYDIAADITQRSSHGSCKTIKGCNKGVHWLVPASEGDCSLAPSYDDVVKAVDGHLRQSVDGTICRAKCLNIAKNGEWKMDLVLGTSEFAVRDPVRHVSECLTFATANPPSPAVDLRHVLPWSQCLRQNEQQTKGTDRQLALSLPADRISV